MIRPDVVLVHTTAPADCPLQVGDSVTIGTSDELFRVTRLWQEVFHGGPQWVAHIVGRSEMSLRVRHLSKHAEV